MGASLPDLHQSFVYVHGLGTKTPGPQICTPLEKILRVPMPVVQISFYIYSKSTSSLTLIL